MSQHTAYAFTARISLNSMLSFMLLRIGEPANQKGAWEGRGVGIKLLLPPPSMSARVLDYRLEVGPSGTGMTSFKSDEKLK
ncbi:jg23600 [Pararge aegeria aegeria]|uniref:Jg23600 protein n=1 Tax=Pararge aegeria aegeria TaxID=348720 RepID=A0A8S4SDI8_9NEOP|nr:jg23600 [Pararge aegeria aegeria]